VITTLILILTHPVVAITLLLLNIKTGGKYKEKMKKELNGKVKTGGHPRLLLN
jgi:hypothetical protein